MNKPVEIIIHCSATPVGKDYTLQDIINMHKKRGFTTIGYHYYITKDGCIHQGRPISMTGAHCLGHNDKSIGICYEGGLLSDLKPCDTRTFAQKASLKSLILDCKRRYPAISAIFGHRDFAHKDCPCFDAYNEYMPLFNHFEKFI